MFLEALNIFAFKVYLIHWLQFRLHVMVVIMLKFFFGLRRLMNYTLRSDFSESMN
jgi:hypothetical protein